MVHKQFIGVLMLLLVLVGLTGCGSIDVDGTKVKSSEDVEALIATAVKDAETKLEQSAEKAIAEIKAEADAKLQTSEEAYKSQVEELQLSLDELQTELAQETEAKEEIISESKKFLITGVSLKGNFKKSYDSVDLEMLSYKEFSHDAVKYGMEEMLVLADSIKPVLNLTDLDGEVAVEIVDEASVIYKVKFDKELDLAGKDLEIQFLGQPLTLISYDGDESIKVRKSVKVVGEEGETITVDGKSITIVSINDDSTKVLVEVDGVKAIIPVNNTKDIDGTVIEIVEALKGSKSTYVEMYVGKEISEDIVTGDKYEDMEDFEWIIEGNAKGLTALSVRYMKQLIDEDVLVIGSKVSLPHDYVSIVFDSIKNMELTDLSMRITATDVRLETDAKVKVGEERVDNGLITFYVKNVTPMYKYRYNGDLREDLTNLSLIELSIQDRVLSVGYNGSVLAVLEDSTVEYGFECDHDVRTFKQTVGDETKINKNDHYRMDNGDLLYKADFEEQVRTVRLGLTGSKDIEVLLRIE